MATETVSIGPVRIPKSYKEGLTALLEGRDHLTYSDLIREAIYLLLVKNKVIIPSRIVFKSPWLGGRTEDVKPKSNIIKGDFPDDD